MATLVVLATFRNGSKWGREGAAACLPVSANCVVRIFVWNTIFVWVAQNIVDNTIQKLKSECAGWGIRILENWKFETVKWVLSRTLLKLFHIGNIVICFKCIESWKFNGCFYRIYFIMIAKQNRVLAIEQRKNSFSPYGFNRNFKAYDTYLLVDWSV